MARKTPEELAKIEELINRLGGRGIPEKAMAELVAWFEKERRK